MEEIAVQSQEMAIGDLQDKMTRLRKAVDTLMIPGTHYGTIPGTGKITLLKPGAELLCEFYKLAPEITILSSHEDPVEGNYSYTMKVKLVSKIDGTVASEGIGAANSGEKRFEKAAQKSGDPFSQQNNIIKQAKKRALLDATLAATRSSGIIDEPNARLTPPQPRRKPAATPSTSKTIDKNQMEQLIDLAKAKNVTPNGMKQLIALRFAKDEAKELSFNEALRLINELEAMPLIDVQEGQIDEDTGSDS